MIFTTMDKSCRECGTPISVDELPVICGGFCEGIQRYHAKCVGLSMDDRDACYHRNVVWMCDECCGLMASKKVRAIINSWKSTERIAEGEVERLRKEVSKLSKALNNFTNSSENSKSIASSSSPSPSPPQLQKTACVNSGILSSTRVFGAPPYYEDETSSCVTEKIKLHLSNIAVDVTEAEVAEMVKESLGADDTPTIKSLLPSWADSSSLEFASFKVEVSASSRTRAFNPSIWPRGVRCREFKDYPRNVWRPTTRNC